MVEYLPVPTDGIPMGSGMSHRAPHIPGPRIALGMEVSRPQLAGALAVALEATTVVEQATATVAARLTTDLVLCDQLGQLPTAWRAALWRAESQATDRLGVGLSPGAAHRFDLDSGSSVVVVHGDGWSLVGRTLSVLIILLDVAPGLVIDRSRAEGAIGLVDGLAARLAETGH